MRFGQAFGGLPFRHFSTGDVSMKEYQHYQDQLREMEREEGRGDAVEQHVPTAFLFLGAAISAGAT